MARRLSGWRKLAGSSWGRPMDPQFAAAMRAYCADPAGFEPALRRGGEPSAGQPAPRKLEADA